MPEGSQAGNPGNSKGERWKCAGCSADMEFDPATGGMKCPYCGVTQAVAEDKARAVVENPLEDIDPSRLAQMSAKAMQVECSTCGSVVTFEPPDVAGECPFCAAKIVVQPKAADPLIAPDGLLPF